jgi:flavin-dependent dehydrogenase
MTGEGIYYAVRSGKIAAISCIGFLEGNPDAIAEYTVNVNRELMTELLEADRIKNVFNTFSSRIHGWIHESDRAWRAFGRILRGERNYADVRLGFGKWKFFWSTVTQVSRWIYSFREKQFAKNGFLTGRRK